MRAGEPSMSAIAVSRPLVGHFMPEEGAARIASLAGFAIIGSLILWASAKISVPFWPVPMTLQTGAVALDRRCLWLAARRRDRGALSAGRGLGTAGLRGHAGEGIGLAYMAGTTGGYLIGFAVAAARRRLARRARLRPQSGKALRRDACAATRSCSRSVSHGSAP